MKHVFNENDFNVVNHGELLRDCAGLIEHFDSLKNKKVTVFLSHRHSQISFIKKIIEYLESEYGVYCYVDADDKAMPPYTSAKTAKILKDRIKECDKFILIGTKLGIESKWCNWEFGFGDAYKFDEDIKKDNLVLLLIGEGKDFDGNEYLGLYPYIIYEDGKSCYKDSSIVIPPGNYVRYMKNGFYYIKPLKEWLNA